MFRIKDFLFKNKTIRQTILKNIFWQVVAQGGGKIIRAGVIIYAARTLGVEEYGSFTYAANVVALFTIIADLAIDPILTREIARGEQRKEGIVSGALCLKLFLSSLSILAILFIAPRVVSIEASKPLLFLIGLSVVFDSLRQFGLAVIKALERMQVEAGVLLLSNIVTAVFGFLALTYWMTPFALSVAYVLGAASGVIAVAFYLKGMMKDVAWRLDFNVIRMIVRDAVPISLVSITGTILMSTDTLILGWLTSATQVGYYNAATKVIALLLIIPSIFVVVLFPIFVRKTARGEGIEVVDKAIAAMNLIAIPITIGGILLAGEIIKCIYGIGYLPAVGPFRILLINILLLYPSIIFGYAVFTYNAHAKTVKYFILAVGVNVILNYLFIIKWGLLGGAIATVLAQSITTIGYYLVLRKLDSFHIAHYLWRPCLSAGGMAIVIQTFLSLGLPIVLVILVAAGVYVICLKLLRDPILYELIDVFNVSIAKNSPPFSS